MFESKFISGKVFPSIGHCKPYWHARAHHPLHRQPELAAENAQSQADGRLADFHSPYTIRRGPATHRHSGFAGTWTILK